MKRSTIIIRAILLLGMFASKVKAQDTSPKDPYAGDIWSRSTLTGD